MSIFMWISVALMICAAAGVRDVVSIQAGSTTPPPPVFLLHDQTFGPAGSSNLGAFTTFQIIMLIFGIIGIIVGVPAGILGYYKLCKKIFPEDENLTEIITQGNSLNTDDSTRLLKEGSSVNVSAIQQMNTHAYDKSAAEKNLPNSNGYVIMPLARPKETPTTVNSAKETPSTVNSPKAEMKLNNGQTLYQLQTTVIEDGRKRQLPSYPHYSGAIKLSGERTGATEMSSLVK